jgi:hypothetical protein
MCGGGEGEVLPTFYPKQPPSRGVDYQRSRRSRRSRRRRKEKAEKTTKESERPTCTMDNEFD